MERATVLALMLLAACSTPRTEILVEVTTDLAVPADINEIRIRVSTTAEPDRFDATKMVGPTDLPVTLGLVPGDDSRLGFRVITSGHRQGMEVVQRSASLSFVPGRTLVLRLDLQRQCRGITCATGQTCRHGACAREEIDPTTLPDHGSADAALPDARLDGGIDRTPGDLPLDGPTEVKPPDAAPEAATMCDPSGERLGTACPMGQECAARMGAAVGLETACIATWSGLMKGQACSNWEALPSDCGPGLGCVPYPGSPKGTCLSLCRCFDGPDGCLDGAQACKWFPDGPMKPPVTCTPGTSGWGAGIGVCFLR